MGPLTPLLFGEETELGATLSTALGAEAGTSVRWFALSHSIEAEVAAASTIARKRTIAKYSMSRRLIWSRP